jgi:hypothetical protein
MSHIKAIIYTEFSQQVLRKIFGMTNVDGRLEKVAERGD